jgi:hypothetical protein
MTEDKFEEFLKTTAQGYNTPPARVPREEMWAAIEAKRAAGPRVVYGGGATYVVGQRRFGTKVWLGAAAAAMLLVATGVGIGRWTAGPTRPADATLPPSQRVVVTPPANTGSESTPEPTSNASTPSAVATGITEKSGGERGPAGRISVVRPPSGIVANGSPVVSGSSSAYQLTAVQHLSEAEALLTSFRARSTADQQMDAQLGAWARQLLSNTRLLLDSPVANDPQRRPLLEDLELVLVQIVQLSPGSTPQDRELIEKTLQQDHVMMRLRTAIPAGAQRGS